jgi:hypothetical protein
MVLLGRGDYSPEVVGPRDRPTAVGAWRYTGKQPIKTADLKRPAEARTSKNTSELHQAINEAIKVAKADESLTERECKDLCIALERVLGQGKLVHFQPTSGKYLPVREGLPKDWLNHYVVQLDDYRVVDPLRNKVYNSLEDLKRDIFTAPVLEGIHAPIIDTAPAVKGGKDSF